MRVAHHFPSSSRILTILFLVAFLLALPTAFCHADEAVDLIRQGTIERITDHVAGDYQFSMYAGFDCFRMSADGSKVLFYAKANDLSTESLRIVNADGTNETIIYAAALVGEGILHLTPCFEISDDGNTVAYILEYAGGVGNAKQIVVYDVPSATNKNLPTQVSVQLYHTNTVGQVDLSIQQSQSGDLFCLSGDGSMVFFINRFGPYSGGVAGIDPSGFTLYQIPTNGLAPASPLFSDDNLRDVPGVIDAAVSVMASGGYIDCDYTGSLVSLPVGGFDADGHPGFHILGVATNAPGTAQILVDLYEMREGVPVRLGLSGPSMSGSGDKLAFSRFHSENAANNGLFVVPTSGGAATCLDPGNAEYGIYPMRPRLSKDGSAVSYYWPMNPTGLQLAKTDGSLVIPVADRICARIDKESAISEDGSRVLFWATVNANPPALAEPDLLRFDWEMVTKAGAPPAVLGVAEIPKAELVLQDGIQPVYRHKFLLYPSGDDLTIMRQFPIDPFGRYPIGIYGTDYALWDDGTSGDDVAGDGIYTDARVWARETYLKLATVDFRAAAMTADGHAAFADYTLPVRRVLPLSADFSANPAEGKAPLTVVFTDLSQGDILNWQWDVDGFWPPEYTNPSGPVSHTYTVPGVYTVKLRVEGFVGHDDEGQFVDGVEEVIKAAYITVLAPEDVDGSGGVNAVDVQMTINAALGIPETPPIDVDEDGDCDAVDIQLVINAALGI